VRIQVLGAGSFGLALTRLLANNGHAVRLWCRRPEEAEALRQTGSSPDYLPGIRLPEGVEVAAGIDARADLVVLCVPSHALRGVLAALPLPEGATRLSVAKGIELDTLRRMSEVIAEAAPGGPVAVLSGPSHAEEVARDLPTSVVVASQCDEAAAQAQAAFFSRAFRVYTSSDVVGVELGGALKNVIAIAAGVGDGLGFGDNAKAALITRGLAEMARLGVACGADALTFAGLSGMGDLIATCGSRHSRNRAVGEAIARGSDLEHALGATTMVAEGVRTTRSAKALADRAGVEMPIVAAVHQVLYEGASPLAALAGLLTREAKPEQY
jgi:glycerol-3-phosphate dehydrogenase (NAD(P)+)